MKIIKIGARVSMRLIGQLCCDGNALTQCLGGGSRNPKAHQVEFGYQTGDKFVLLSYGVPDCVSDEQILNSISRAGSESASDLCERALSLGSGDDLSAIVIDCSE